MQAIADDGPAYGAADLLIGVGQHAVGDEVFRVEAVVAEEAVEAAGEVVGPGARDGLHLHAERPALRDVEKVGDHLELGDGLAAEARLPEAAAGDLLGDLLSVEVQLELPITDPRRVVHGVGRHAAHLHGQFHPVAPLERQFLHLPPVDVATDLRRGDVDERRFTGDRDRLVEGRDLHRERHGAVLADEQFDRFDDDRGEPGNLGLQLVAGRREAPQPILAAVVGDGGEHAAGLEARGRDRHAGERAPGFVADDPQDGGFLSCRRPHTQPDDADQAPAREANAHAPSNSAHTILTAVAGRTLLVYGLHPVLEAIRAGRARTIRVGGRSDRRLSEVIDQARARGVPVHDVPSDLLDRETRHGVHQGIVAEVDPAPSGSLEAFTASLDPPPLIVVLDEVEDPQNVGAILRTMDAVGATGLVRQTRRAATLDGAAAKASAGAVHHVRVADVVNIARYVEALKAAGIWTVGLDAGAELAYYEWDLTLPTALVLGAEGHGLRRLVRERCDGLARIPMRGHVESLNVSAAAAVVLFEAVRQRSRGR